VSTISYHWPSCVQLNWGMSDRKQLRVVLGQHASEIDRSSYLSAVIADSVRCDVVIGDSERSGVKAYAYGLCASCLIFFFAKEFKDV
jgi:hypothetical protein